MMRLPSFRYLEPKTLEQALRLRAEAGPDGAYVAGGTDLYPNMKRRQQTPGVVVSLARIRELKASRSAEPGSKAKPAAGAKSAGLVLGAGRTLTEICGDHRVREEYPALARAVSLISTPLLRNMGTIGGNLLLDTRCNYYDQNYEWRKAIDFCMKKDGKICWVAPASRKCLAVQSADAPPILIALGAKIRLVSPDGSERLFPLEELYRDDGIDYAAKRPEELLTEVELPPAGLLRATYWKLRRRGSFDFPVLSVAASIRAGADGFPEDVSIILGGLSSCPVRAVRAETIVRDSGLTEEGIEQAAQAAFACVRAMDNTDFSFLWRKQMVRRYVGGALRELRGSGQNPARDAGLGAEI
jgi:4-hydroxybenzoyl-CoA reductase subunit beta